MLTKLCKRVTDELCESESQGSELRDTDKFDGRASFNVWPNVIRLSNLKRLMIKTI